PDPQSNTPPARGQRQEYKKVGKRWPWAPPTVLNNRIRGRRETAGPARREKGPDRGPFASIAVVLGLERAVLRHADIVGLVLRQRGELGAELGEMQLGHLFVEPLGQHMH